MSSIKQIVETFISGDQSTKVYRTANSLAELVEGESTQEDVENAVYTLMSTIARSVRDVPASSPKQGRLVALLDSLRSIGPLDGDKFRTSGGLVWSDIPMLGSELRDTWNCSPDDTTAEQWTNMNAFVARLTSSGVSDDFSLYGIWSYRTALETEGANLEFGLSGALAWLEYSGSKLLDLSRQQKDFAPPQGNQPNPAWLGSLAKEAGIERKGFSVQRWDFWKKRLEEISTSSDGASGLASQCLQKIKSLK